MYLIHIFNIVVDIFDVFIYIFDMFIDIFDIFIDIYIYIYIDLLFRRLIISHQTGPSSFSVQRFSLNICVFDTFLRFCLPICVPFLACLAPSWPPRQKFEDFLLILGGLGTTWR